MRQEVYLADAPYIVLHRYISRRGSSPAENATNSTIVGAEGFQSCDEDGKRANTVSSEYLVRFFCPEPQFHT